MGTDWKTASELADKSFTVPHRSAVKFLLSLREAGVVEAIDKQWVDDRFRKRKRLMFRLKVDNTERINVLNNIFARAIPVTDSKPRVHLLK